MIEQQINELIDEELQGLNHIDATDLQCFIEHRIQPSLIELSLDISGQKWKSCYLLTEHNGENDSAYRAAFDPETGHFVRELTLADGTPHYLSRHSDLEAIIDAFAS